MRMIPMRTNAASIRISFDNSFGSFFGGVGELIQMSVRRPWWNQVRSAFVERVTSAEAFEPQPYAFRGAMYFDRFTHVLGAGRIITAGRRQKRRYQTLVSGDGKDEDFAHLIKRRRTSA